ncbi:hypothetical protein AGMMS50293_00920 [Spirochaetia bacterium]|nr:hypothetical protein AGMMS50293_00920 [Spirochaetia bacterium]
MKQKRTACFLLILMMAVSALTAQQFNSVPLGHTAYDVIEMGILRGIIVPPASVRPWSEFTIKEKLRGILNDSAGRLSQKELDIVSRVLSSFEKKGGLNLREGKYRSDYAAGRYRFSFEAGLNWESNFSVRVPDPATSTVNLGKIFLGGDMSEHFSWNFAISAGFLGIDREELGLRPDPPYVDPKNGPYDGNPNSRGHYYYYDIPPSSSSMVYGIPAWFPYTFSKPWEAGVFPPDNLGGYAPWPDGFAYAYEMTGELNINLFDDHLYLRFGRMRRDWGPEENGSSLYMNAMARPFVAIEGTAIPFSWLRFSFLTGVLEYLNDGSQWSDADPYQNLFSLAMLEVDTGKHFHFDFGSATVWPKRFDLGYIFPINSNFFYQNNVGDFDNLALFMDIEFRFPGVAKIWGSLFVDEIRPALGSFFKLDRNMYAYQGGIKANVNWLPFGAVTLRYTKVEPYTYTHEYTDTPWNRVPADTAYLNNGESLGFYLPPNSDELLVRLESMLLPELRAHVQYQMIRHGAEYGPRRVDGSSLRDKIVKDDNDTKYFLRDGVYEWNHVLKLGASYSLKSRGIPLSFYTETGLVVTRFTDSDAPLHEEGSFSSIDNAVYRAGTGFIFSIGFKLYPDI